MRGTMGTLSRVAVTMAVAALLVTGCSAQPKPGPATPAPSAPGSATPAPMSTFDAAATADEAKPFFDSVNTATLTGNKDAKGRDFIDALSAAGFDKAAMELTADATTIGNAADSIQFAVRWGESCLVGQNGPAVGGYQSTIAPVLGTGRCLIGDTRPIDW